MARRPFVSRREIIAGRIVVNASVKRFQTAAKRKHFMQVSIKEILSSYDDQAPLSQASTIPAPWYIDPRIAELEMQNVFSKTWQLVARTDQLENGGDFVTSAPRRRTHRCGSGQQMASCAAFTTFVVTTPQPLSRNLAGRLNSAMSRIMAGDMALTAR